MVSSEVRCLSVCLIQQELCTLKPLKEVSEGFFWFEGKGVQSHVRAGSLQCENHTGL